MRSRYTAFTQNNTDYIKQTMHEQALADFNEAETKRWAKRVKWIKLEVLQVAFKNSNTATVVFEACYVDGPRFNSIYEKSEFKREDGQWYYFLGTHLPPRQPEKIISRSQACPCGSLRKFKNCHGV